MVFVAKRSIDWSAICAAYTTNDCSIRALARAHNLSEGAIRKRAKCEKWVRAERQKCAPRTAADRSREQRKRDQAGIRYERVPLRPGEMVLVVDIGATADRLGVPDWDSEDVNAVRERLKLELEKLGRNA